MRLPGWETRFALAVENARHEPFVWGLSDCFSFACAVVSALTGEDHWSVFKDTYHTKHEALRIISSHAGNFDEFVTQQFNTEKVNIKLARRGDLIMVPQPGMDALGVCLGGEVAVRLEHMLGFLPRSRAVCAWRVG